MQIVTGMNIYNKILDASIVTIGNFDGVHRGHAEIFSHLRRKSCDRGLPSVVVTFEPHPLKVLAPESAPLLITTFEQKTALIEESGIDYLVVVPFSKEFSLLSARDFVLNILCTPLGMKHIIIGHDYAFGRGREGSFKTLVSLGALNGFTLEDLPPIGEEGVVFSSSLVRSAVAEGDMGAASRILGRYYRISGAVVHGREIGQTLGFPTANISTSNELLPPDGVYAVMAEVDGQIVKGACNIGFNPTFGGETRTIEVFLLDYSGLIYDHGIEVHFVQRLRSVQKFPDVAALKSAISRDVANARIILEKVNAHYLRCGARSEPCA
ncbi:MAG: bifunctional riboflavin kinase/FAD synthetase [Desulfuromonadaceae bacterium]|nr:bifunctional riboflavin kinase/FAD synthetase [Desulfuromonadaceae bacterium]MDD2849361.1 bifunctional riboflavin kinase/FAD synthetase [Desulfuromonadaceae bacterium]MDD4129420.1 bifunctional riboflavin kinase/FAD synthetase [Desulfuromonadaceae bacterium]